MCASDGNKTGHISASLKEHIKEHLVVEYKNGKVRLHDSYRRFGENNATATQTDNERAFVWFVENILVECGGTATRKCAFRELKTKKELSNIFTSMDEAWALLVLLNEHHLWDWDLQNPPTKKPNDDDDISLGGAHRKKKPRGRASKPSGAPKKKFTDWKRGSSDGWGDMGRDAFAQILDLVEARRAEDSSQEWETHFMCDEREAVMRHQNNDEDSTASTIGGSGTSEDTRFRTKPIQSYEGDLFWSVQASEFAQM